MNGPKQKERRSYDIIAVKDRLNAYRDMERDIDNQLERIENIETKMYSVGSPVMSDMPKNPNTSGDRISRFVERKDQLQRKLDLMYDHQNKEKAWIDGVLAHVKTADERSVIEMRYFDSENWNNIARMLFGNMDDYVGKEDSYLRRTTKLHGRALVSMAKYLYDLENKKQEGVQ